MAKPLRVLEEKLGPERLARARAKTDKMLQALALDELREERDMTQVELAELLGVNQAAVSKLERRGDLLVSTLRRVVEALDGRLEIRAVFPNGTVEILPLGERHGITRRDAPASRRTKRALSR
jgi:transcriptional regulator with XRE-family HTH domain